MQSNNQDLATSEETHENQQMKQNKEDTVAMDSSTEVLVSSSSNTTSEVIEKPDENNTKEDVHEEISHRDDDHAGASSTVVEASVESSISQEIPIHHQPTAENLSSSILQSIVTTTTTASHEDEMGLSLEETNFSMVMSDEGNSPIQEVADLKHNHNKSEMIVIEEQEEVVTITTSTINNSPQESNTTTLFTTSDRDDTTDIDLKTSDTTTSHTTRKEEKLSFIQSIWASKVKWQTLLERTIINNKSRIEILKTLGNLMYLGSRSRTDVDLDNIEDSEKLLLNDIYETEKISSVITLIGWYQDFVADKHKLQNVKIQEDERFSSHHKVGQYLRLFECVILLAEIMYKRMATTPKGVTNYWKYVTVIEVVRTLLKLISIFKSKTNAPMFLNYTTLPPDEESMSLGPMASMLPSLPKFSPFEKEQQSIAEYKNQKKSQTKPKVGSRSGRKIPSSDEIYAVVKGGSSRVPTTSELGKQLGISENQAYILLPGYNTDMSRTKGKILMYIAEVLYAVKPVVYTLLLAKYGFKSWKPFVISLILEISSLYLTKKAIAWIEADQKDLLPDCPPNAGLMVEDEFKRRINNLSHYLYRGPLFELVMDRIFKSILLPILKRIPLIGGSFGKLLIEHEFNKTSRLY